MHKEKLVSRDRAAIDSLLREIVDRKEDFTKGDLFSFLFYKQDPLVVSAVKEFSEVHPYILIPPLSSSLSIPDIIVRLKDILRFEVNAMKLYIMEAFARSIKVNRVKYELLYEQLAEHSKSERNSYERDRLLKMIEYIKRPESTVNPFAGLSL